MSVLRTVDLPGPLIVVPSPSLDGRIRRLRADHPHLPVDVDQLTDDLNSRTGQGGAPATLAEPGKGKTDWSLLVHGRAYVARLYAHRAVPGAFEVGAVHPLRFADHHRIASGCLLLRPARWQPRYESADMPPDSVAHWGLLEQEWQRLTDDRAAERGTRELSAGQTGFLDLLGRVIDADERITRDKTGADGPFPYRSVKATGERRHDTRSVYEFEVDADRRPGADAYVQIAGEPGYRGKVTGDPTGGASVTVAFDRAVDWHRLPRQGELETWADSTVHNRQRDAVRALRERTAANPNLLGVLVDHVVRPVRPASDNPTEELDPEQLEAFRKALAVEDLMLVLGPPGTGKTRVISQIARAAATREAPSRVLVAAQSNRAVDNVLTRLPKDLVVVRIGTEGRVTSDGEEFLLERQVAHVRQEILDRTRNAGAARFDSGEAKGWAAELNECLLRLHDGQAEEGVRSSALAEARRAAGGEAQLRVDRITAEGSRLEREQDRAARGTDRLTRSRSVALRCTGWWLIGVLFRLLVRDRDRRLAVAARVSTDLLAAAYANRARLDEAERELDAATRDVPAVREAASALAAARKRSAMCRADAFAAVRPARAAVAAVREAPAVRDPATAPPEDTDRDLVVLRDWLAEQLPRLAARHALLTEWREEVGKATRQLQVELLRYAHVVAATCSTASRPVLSGVDFDLAIVDEAGQVGVADVLVPLVRARRAVLVGDERQLPPYLDDELKSWGKQLGDPRVAGMLADSALGILRPHLPRSAVVPLTTQRRMPLVIADFVSAAFYGGALHSQVPDPAHDALLFRTPMAFVDTSTLPLGQRAEKEARTEARRGHRGYVNPVEARLLTRLAAHYDRRGVEWAVIVPYSAQVTRITDALAKRTGRTEHVGLNVGTVDSFQGGERDVILYGFTRSNDEGRVGFLDELRRANVAFTRAKRQLVVVGDMSTLTVASDHGFRELACALRDHLVRRGEIHPYQDIWSRLDGIESEEGGGGR